MSFLLDTDTCSAYLKSNRSVFNRFMQHSGGFSITAWVLLLWCCATANAAPATTRAAVREEEAGFWRWFDSNKERLLKAVETRDEAVQGRAIDEIEAELAKVRPGLSALIGGKKDPKEGRAIVITAQTQVELFEAVKSLVAAAPEMRGWKAVAFRPRMMSGDEPVTITYRGERLAGSDVWFGATRVEGGKLDVTLYVRGLTDENYDQRAGAAVLMLDHTIGEYDAGTMIRRLMAKALPEEGKVEGLRPMKELAGFVDGEKGAR